MNSLFHHVTAIIKSRLRLVCSPNDARFADAAIRREHEHPRLFVVFAVVTREEKEGRRVVVVVAIR